MQSQVIETSAIELAFENDAAVEAWFISDEVRSHSHCGEPLRVEAPLHSTNVQDDQEPVECVDKLHQELARLQADKHCGRSRRQQACILSCGQRDRYGIACVTSWNTTRHGEHEAGQMIVKIKQEDEACAGASSRGAASSTPATSRISVSSSSRTQRRISSRVCSPRRR